MANAADLLKAVSKKNFKGSLDSWTDEMCIFLEGYYSEEDNLCE